MKTVYVGLGSNLGDRAGHLGEAVSRLHGTRLRVRRISSVFETEPQGLKEQGWFLNAVLEAETDLFPLQLLHHLLQIEREMGRKRRIPNGPRRIDLDLLLYANAVIGSAELTIPHPCLHERRFVLAPLAELCPDGIHPVLHRSFRALLGGLKGQEVRRTGLALGAPAP